MLKIDLYTTKGTKTGSLTLPKEFDEKPNLNLLAQAIRVYEERGHIGLRQAKTRSEVNRTTKKVYKQKGTGGARHGSRRAPIFVGGGVAFGPRALRRELTLPAKLVSKARNQALTHKVQSGEVVGLKEISKLTKTKVANEFGIKLREHLKPKTLSFVLSEKNKASAKFVRNLSYANVFLFKDVNAYHILKGGGIVLDEDIFSDKKQTKIIKPKTTNKK